jgi:hypothetical protein
MRVRLRELFDCHLQATNDHRGHTKALRLLGHIVEHVLECGSISHMLIRTISHMLLKKSRRFLLLFVTSAMSAMLHRSSVRRKGKPFRAARVSTALAAEK